MTNVATFGSFEDRPVLAATLTSDTGVSVVVLSFGCIVQHWRVPDRTGFPRDVNLGFPTLQNYLDDRRSFGVIAGRVANRIRDGRFTLAGVEHQLDRNHGPHSLHGGARGFGKQNFALEASADRVRLTHTTPDGHAGYPGAVDVTVDIVLAGDTVTFDMTALPTQATLINLAQHSYYALGGPVSEHVLGVAASRVTAVDELLIPTGRLVDVAGTPLDFRTPRPIGSTEIDHNFCLDGTAPAATLEGSDFRLSLSTDRAGVQVYDTFSTPPIPFPGHGGVHYGPWCGVCLEAQEWPDSVNHQHFPSTIYTPDRPYRQTTAVTITAR